MHWVSFKDIIIIYLNQLCVLLHSQCKYLSFLFLIAINLYSFKLSQYDSSLRADIFYFILINLISFSFVCPIFFWETQIYRTNYSSNVPKGRKLSNKAKMDLFHANKENIFILRVPYLFLQNTSITNLFFKDSRNKVNKQK